MLILRMYTVRDEKAEAYLPPFCARTPGEAERMFLELSTDPQHQFCKHAEDFSLVEVGSFDQETGAVKGLPAPVFVVRAADLKMRAEGGV